MIKNDIFQFLLLYCFMNEIHLSSTYLRNEFNFWNVHRSMNTLDLLQSKWLTLQEIRSIHDSMNRQQIEFIAYIFIFIINT